MKKLFYLVALVAALCVPICAMAATEPNTKTIEETTSMVTEAGGVGIPVRVLDGGGATSTVFGVRVVAAEGSANDGKSSIGMILSQGAKLRVVESRVHAADGRDGEPGEDAPRLRAKDGEYGNDGADACTEDVATGRRVFNWLRVLHREGS